MVTTSKPEKAQGKPPKPKKRKVVPFSIDALAKLKGKLSFEELHTLTGINGGQLSTTFQKGCSMGVIQKLSRGLQTDFSFGDHSKTTAIKYEPGGKLEKAIHHRRKNVLKWSLRKCDAELKGTISQETLRRMETPGFFKKNGPWAEDFDRYLALLGLRVMVSETADTPEAP